jgi:5-methylcytosine-specific restriction enzyme A
MQALSRSPLGNIENGNEVVRELSRKLPGRSDGAIIRRMQSISTVLDKNGMQWAKRFGPRHGVGAGVETRLLALIIDRQATSDPHELERQTRAARTRMLVSTAPPPVGNNIVVAETTHIVRFRRLASVQAWVLAFARGRCEGCQSDAPFNSMDDYPFLEVHHLRPLAEGGPDTIDKYRCSLSQLPPTVALQP